MAAFLRGKYLKLGKIKKCRMDLRHLCSEK